VSFVVNGKHVKQVPSGKGARLRIGIDFTAAVQQGGGIGRLTRNVIGALAEIDRDNDYRLFVAAGRGRKGEWQVGSLGSAFQTDGHPNFRLKTVPVSDHALAVAWHRLRLPLFAELFTGQVDLFHSPDFTLPPVWRARALVTVHDLSFLRVPECFPEGLLRYLEAAVPRALRRADHVIADSYNTRRDLVELLGTPETKVSVIHCGVEPRFRPMTGETDDVTLAAVRRKYDLPGRFVLGVGTIQPRKNYGRLVEAFSSLKAQGLLRGWQLIIAGGRGWLYESLFERVETLGLRDEVRFLGFVDDADLPALYNLARVFAFPSLYEGFGIPPLEAMACGVPVVCSDASSLPEAVGDAALTVDPLDVAGLAEAIHRAIEDESLRASLVARGQTRAAAFTWSKAARKLLAVYTHMA
jgi:glycosyltransferase involved in cell wall biosynthesis